MRRSRLLIVCRVGLATVCGALVACDEPFTAEGGRAGSPSLRAGQIGFVPQQPEVAALGDDRLAIAWTDSEGIHIDTLDLSTGHARRPLATVEGSATLYDLGEHEMYVGGPGLIATFMRSGAAVAEAVVIDALGQVAPANPPDDAGLRSTAYGELDHETVAIEGEATIVTLRVRATSFDPDFHGCGPPRPLTADVVAELVPAGASNRAGAREVIVARWELADDTYYPTGPPWHGRLVPMGDGLLAVWRDGERLVWAPVALR